jgi:hypothetical protein
MLQGPDSVLIGMGGANPGIETLTGIQVMIVAVNACSLKSPGSFLSEEPQRVTYFYAYLLLYPADYPAEALQLLSSRSTAAGYNAVSFSFGGSSQISSLQDFLFPQQRVFFNRRLGNSGLRTIGTIFRAKTALGIDQKMKNHLFPEIPFSDPESSLEQVQDSIPWRTQDSITLFPVQGKPLKGYFG